MTPDTPADGALAEAIAELPMVKPLEWVETQSEIPHHAWETWTGFGRWVIVLRFQSMNAATYWLFSLGYPTLEAAKSAAQADYTARVRAALIPRPAEPAQAAQVDVMVNLYVELENLLAVYSEPDKQLCCDGHMCGCQGATEYQQAEHYAKAALDEARALIAAAQEGRG